MEILKILEMYLENEAICRAWEKFTKEVPNLEVKHIGSSLFLQKKGDDYLDRVCLSDLDDNFQHYIDLERQKLVREILGKLLKEGE